MQVKDNDSKQPVGFPPTMHVLPLNAGKKHVQHAAFTFLQLLQSEACFGTTTRHYSDNTTPLTYLRTCLWECQLALELAMSELIPLVWFEHVYTLVYGACAQYLL
jgi:hypothetical protein